MLQIITSHAQLDFGQLMQVYHQSLLKSGRENNPDFDENRQLLEAEQDFYLFLKSFLREKGSVCAVWISEGKYVSALRAEPYRDGVLIEGLETAPTCRRQGYAKLLLRGILEYLNERGAEKIYSHIQRDNIPSIRTHLSCGFVCICDYAAYIDGSVDHKSSTYLFYKDSTK